MIDAGARRTSAPTSAPCTSRCTWPASRPARPPRRTSSATSTPSRSRRRSPTSTPSSSARSRCNPTSRSPRSPHQLVRPGHAEDRRRSAARPGRRRGHPAPGLHQDDHRGHRGGGRLHRRLPRRRLVAGPRRLADRLGVGLGPAVHGDRADRDRRRVHRQRVQRQLPRGLASGENPFVASPVRPERERGDEGAHRRRAGGPRPAAARSSGRSPTRTAPSWSPTARCRRSRRSSRWTTSWRASSARSPDASSGTGAPAPVPAPEGPARRRHHPVPLAVRRRPRRPAHRRARGPPASVAWPPGLEPSPPRVRRWSHAVRGAGGSSDRRATTAPRAGRRPPP